MSGGYRPQKNTAQFIAEATLKHSGKYTYEKTVYVRSTDKVIITCKDHGDYEMVAAKHLYGQQCKECAKKIAGDSRKITKDCFVERSRQVHGDKYDYSLSNVDGGRKLVEIICPLHDKFLLTPDKHTQGRGCPKCSWNGAGFDRSKPASLYILTSGDITKVGITNRKVAARVHGISRASGLVFKLHTSIFSEGGGFTRDVEQKTLAWLRSKYQTVDKKFDGYTECFMSVDMEELLSFISPNNEHIEVQE